MSEPKRLQNNPMYAVVDAAIRKEISWQEARARLRALIEEQPDLFEDLYLGVIEDLYVDDGSRDRTAAPGADDNFIH